MTTTAAAQITIPLDIPDIEVIDVARNQAGNWLLTVTTQSNTTVCGVCLQTIACKHGCGRTLTLRHLPILGEATYIRIAPKRAKCPTCANSPTTTQTVTWYEAHSPHTKAYDAYLMLQLKGSTVMDVSQMEAVGYDAIVGALKRQVPAEVDWDQIEDLGTLGIDEVATQKGRKRYRAVITARQADGQRHILAVLPDRKKNGQGVSR
jgi:transposase